MVKFNGKSKWQQTGRQTSALKRFIILIFVKTYFVVEQDAIYTPSINGNAKPTHIVRLVATLSSSIKESAGPQKRTNRIDRLGKIQILAKCICLV